MDSHGNLYHQLSIWVWLSTLNWTTMNISAISVKKANSTRAFVHPNSNKKLSCRRETARQLACLSRTTAILRCICALHDQLASVDRQSAADALFLYGSWASWSFYLRNHVCLMNEDKDTDSEGRWTLPRPASKCCRMWSDTATLGRVDPPPGYAGELHHATNRTINQLFDQSINRSINSNTVLLYKNCY